MPPIERHVQISKERTGKEYREIHEWLDGDAEKKAERHDITKMYEYAKMFEQKYGLEGADEYIQHIHDDLKGKFGHLLEDLAKALTETLNYFGVK